MPEPFRRQVRATPMRRHIRRGAPLSRGLEIAWFFNVIRYTDIPDFSGNHNDIILDEEGWSQGQWGKQFQPSVTELQSPNKVFSGDPMTVVIGTKGGKRSQGDMGWYDRKGFRGGSSDPVRIFGYSKSITIGTSATAFDPYVGVVTHDYNGTNEIRGWLNGIKSGSKNTATLGGLSTGPLLGRSQFASPRPHHMFLLRYGRILSDAELRQISANPAAIFDWPRGGVIAAAMGAAPPVTGATNKGWDWKHA